MREPVLLLKPQIIRSVVLPGGPASTTTDGFRGKRDLYLRRRPLNPDSAFHPALGYSGCRPTTDPPVRLRAIPWTSPPASSVDQRLATFFPTPGGTNRRTERPPARAWMTSAPRLYARAGIGDGACHLIGGERVAPVGRRLFASVINVFSL